MTIVAPTMSTKGWAKTPEAIIDTVFTHYVCNNPSQSLPYEGSIYSLQAAIKSGGGIMERVAEDVQHGLKEMLSRYFPLGVSVECTYNYIDGNDSKVNLDISGQVNTGSEILNLVKSFTNINSKFFVIADVKLK